MYKTTSQSNETDKRPETLIQDKTSGFKTLADHKKVAGQAILNGK